MNIAVRELDRRSGMSGGKDAECYKMKQSNVTIFLCSAGQFSSIGGRKFNPIQNAHQSFLILFQDN